MDAFLTPMNLMALITAVAGVALFAVAPSLPSPFPPAVTRFIGFGVLCAALAPLWALHESWGPPALVGALGVGALAIIHLVQTRRG